MLYINENTEEIKVPCHAEKLGTGYTFEVINNLTKVHTSEDVEDENESTLYFKFDIEGKFQNLTVGEYTYKIKQEDNLIEIGLLVYGDYTKENTQYNKSNTIKTYKR